MESSQILNDQISGKAQGKPSDEIKHQVRAKVTLSGGSMHKYSTVERNFFTSTRSDYTETRKKEGLG